MCQRPQAAAKFGSYPDMAAALAAVEVFGDACDLDCAGTHLLVAYLGGDRYVCRTIEDGQGLTPDQREEYARHRLLRARLIRKGADPALVARLDAGDLSLTDACSESGLTTRTRKSARWWL